MHTELSRQAQNSVASGSKRPIPRSKQAVILGDDPSSLTIVRDLVHSSADGYTIVGVLDYDGMKGTSVKMELGEMIGGTKIDMLFISSNALGKSSGEVERFCRSNRIRFSVFPSLPIPRFLASTSRALAGIPSLSLCIGCSQEWSSIVKRFLDLTLSCCLVIISIPLCCIAALVIKLDSRGPVIFKQRRSLSAFDDPFVMYKFRTMEQEAEKRRDNLVNELKAPLFKARNDPRVTRLGRFMRRFSIDELPQLINVIRGEMSLVGPRPLPVDDFHRGSAKNDDDLAWRLRSGVKPGITGLWQVTGRCDLGVREMLLLDLYYIAHRNLMLDLWILAKTVPALLMGRGAY